MKKSIAVLLILTMLFISVPFAGAAEFTAENNVIQVIAALGIMNGDEKGNLNLDKTLTRAEYAKILVCASAYKDSTASVSNVSPFKDVPFTHWAAGYIKTAAQNKWVTGYLDGTYRPDNYLKLEEAVTAALKLLGYSGSDFTGSYPYAQLALYRSLGLSKNITATQGSIMTRRECMNLIYNLLTAKSKTSGNAYITTLGYKVNASNQIDYAEIVNESMEGPLAVMQEGLSGIVPFSLGTAVIYKNGERCGINDIALYDVVYYSIPMKTVWAYNSKASGTYEKAVPTSDYPTSVTVSGKTYSISSSSAAYALSSVGRFVIGDVVTLLLGKDGSVASVVPASEANSQVYGIVVSAGSKEFLDQNGESYNARVLTIAETSGVAFEYISDYYGVGDLVTVSFAGGKASVSSLPRSTLTGTVSIYSDKIGKYNIASGIEILDVQNDKYVRIYPTRLDGTEFEQGSVLFYSLNGKGELDRLILNNITNDMHSFGLVTDIAKSSETGRSYTLILGGAETKVSTKAGMYDTASTGGCMVIKDGNSIKEIKGLVRAETSELGETAAKIDTLTFPLSEKVSVYVKNGNGYYQSSVSIVADIQLYSLDVYYDKPAKSGGRIRVIVATPKPQ